MCLGKTYYTRVQTYISSVFHSDNLGSGSRNHFVVLSMLPSNLI